MWRKAPAFWQSRGAASTALLPAAALYGVAVQLRNAMAVPVHASVPVICIGNLVAGGAGKTPVAIAVAELVRGLSAAPFFLSRGYGGAARGPLRVQAHHTAHDVGDEPLLLAAYAPTVVAKNRVAGAKFAAAAGASLIIMDDGFQNPTLHKDFSLLVLDGAYGFGNGRLLPAGPLREEAAAGIARASAVLVMDGDLPAPGKPLFHASLLPDDAAAALRGQRVAGFAGIARPEKFHATLAHLGADVVAFSAFPDHHPYREFELTALEHTANGALLVTTAKDAVRLPPGWREKVSVVPVRAVISEAEQLKRLLQEVVRHA